MFEIAGVDAVSVNTRTGQITEDWLLANNTRKGDTTLYGCYMDVIIDVASVVRE
jgi:hypothetical protein